MELFRSEATRSANRLHGEVSLAPPLSWQVTGYFLAGLLVVAMFFLSIAGYAQRVTGKGAIASEQGVLSVAPPRAGRISAMLVREGQRVRKGQMLARLAFASFQGGDTLEARRAAAARQQAQALAGRTSALAEAAAARIAALAAQGATARATLGQIDGRIAEQRALLSSAEEDLARAQEVARSGYISRNELRVREETRTERRQELLRLMQDRSDVLGRIDVAQANARRERAELEASRLDALQSQGALAGLAAADTLQTGLDLVAPADGIVTGIAGSLGATPSPDRPLLSIVPARAHLIVRLVIPAAGIGFVRPGQQVAVALDAFPRELFGTQPARIISVTAAGTPNAETGAPEFVAEATLNRPFITAYGMRQPLLPGMTLSATIVTRRLSLMRWLLDPLYAVARR